jgi:hypothetical protein
MLAHANLFKYVIVYNENFRQLLYIEINIVLYLEMTIDFFALILYLQYPFNLLI